MGSSNSGKKHKKDKKHKRNYDGEIDLTGDVYESEEGSQQRSGKHKRHKEHREHKHKHRERERVREKERHRERPRERYNEVIAVQESDSDSSDCVEVPVDNNLSVKRHNERDNEISAPPPPPPQLSRQELDREREKERIRDREERERLREKDRERIRERERERDRERDREYEYERERERIRERERREREREYNEYERERERQRDRDRDREYERDRIENNERSRYRERIDNSRSSARAARSRSHSPIPENGAGDVLSIEETNKLRAKLGLKPLEVDSNTTTSANKSNEKSNSKTEESSLNKYKDEWGEFQHKPAGNLAEKANLEKLRDKLKARKEKRKLEERLARIRTLGESDDEIDDVQKWVKRSKTEVDVKKEAAKRAKALEELDAEFEAEANENYKEHDLKGLRVEHDVEEFTEGKTVILTLKDNDVLNEEENDTLVNVNMVDNERYRVNVQNKKSNLLSYGYNVYEEQYDEFGNPLERNVLEKYDQDLDGVDTKKRKAFVIGQKGIEKTKEQKLLEIKNKLAGKRLETLADVKITPASEVFSEVELEKFKKPKKKVKKLRKKLKADDLLPLGVENTEDHLGNREMEEKEQIEVKDEKIPDEDENELERVLSKARKLKQIENVIKKPLPIDMQNIKQEVKVEVEEPIQLRSAEGNIILNSTAEFCRTLGDIPTYGLSGNRIQDSNEIIDYEEQDLNENGININGDLHSEQIEYSNHGTWNSVNPDEVMQPADLDNIAEGANLEERAILDEEPDVGAGVANALRLALSKGYLEREEHNRPSNSKMAHLQAKNYSIEDKSVADDDKFGRRDRFHAGPIVDFKDKETFKPNVKLEYIDDGGRILNLKEAFRYLSHKFHGKGPGKNKIEKRLKKMEQDGLMKTMSSTDTPLGTLTMLQQKQKETKTPYVVLSGGKPTNNGFGSTNISKFK